MGDPETARARATDACPSCGGSPRWERLLDGDEERWLAICGCGRMRAFLPDHPALDPEDPLRAFLLGPWRPILPPSPPWIRLFLASIEAPDPVRWRFRHGRCRGCAASAVFGLQAGPRPGVFATCALCLACGHVTAHYWNAGRGLYEGPARGRAWAPPCPAVQRLRECLRRPHSLLLVDGWHSEDDEGPVPPQT